MEDKQNVGRADSVTSIPRDDSETNSNPLMPPGFIPPPGGDFAPPPGFAGGYQSFPPNMMPGYHHAPPMGNFSQYNSMPVGQFPAPGYQAPPPPGYGHPVPPANAYPYQPHAPYGHPPAQYQYAAQVPPQPLPPQPHQQPQGSQFVAQQNAQAQAQAVAQANAQAQAQAEAEAAAEAKAEQSKLAVKQDGSLKSESLDCLASPSSSPFSRRKAFTKKPKEESNDSLNITSMSAMNLTTTASAANVTTTPLGSTSSDTSLGSTKIEKKHMQNKILERAHKWKKGRASKPTWCCACGGFFGPFATTSFCRVCTLSCHPDCLDKSKICFGFGGLKTLTGKHHSFVESNLGHGTCCHCGSGCAGSANKCVDCGLVAHRKCRLEVPANCQKAASQATSSNTAGSAYSKKGYKAKYPIILVPGLASSALECIQSVRTPSYENTRIWLSLVKLGTNALKNTGKFNAKIVDGSADGLTDVVGKQTNDWLQHIALINGKDDPEGIVVRPMKGLNAVDFLEPSALTQSASYVFGPVIHNLRDVGYNDGNLVAVPYDWRLSPYDLEKRDGFFTNTLETIEDVYKRNCNTPVVLVAHSMGNCCTKYLLHFAEKVKGRPWIDKHIKSFFAAGGPFLGSYKTQRAACDGDDMGLVGFLNQAEARILCRSIGSCGWLFPKGVCALTDIFFVRQEGLILFNIEAVHFDGSDSKDRTFQISCNGKTLQTAPIFPKSDTPFSGAFQFHAQSATTIVPGECIDLKMVGSKASKSHKASISLNHELTTERGQLQIGNAIVHYTVTFAPSHDRDVAHVSNNERYSLRTGEQFFNECGAGEVWANSKTLYNHDPLVANNYHVAPPVSEMYCVYGVGLPTEAKFGWRAKASAVNNSWYMKYKLDNKFEIDGYKCSNGAAFETEQTPQIQPDTGETIYQSGDGTVQYSSLRYPMVWNKGNNNIKVTCCELPGLEHREMLNEDKFLNVLLEYVCEQ